MAKELPYFKFEPSQWENGSIQICSFEEQGVFINLCSMYWQRLGELPYKLAVQKICNGNATALDSLYQNDIIKIVDGMICIDFLNEQLSEFENISNKNSENARSRWEKQRNNTTVMRPHSERNAIREEEIREEEKREEKRKEEEITIYPSFDDFWNLYGKKIDRSKCEKKWAKLTQVAREKIMDALPAYVQSTPEIEFRRHPATYLNNKSWENEIIIKSNGTGNKKGVDVNAAAEHIARHIQGG